jgi:hypothetical protein
MNYNKDLINGPINVIRLEGNINNIKKVIYLFMDLHLDVNKQLKCEEYYSADIKDYLVKEFMNLDIKVDFLFETSSINLSKESIFKGNYISEIHDMFNKSFQTKNNKVIRPELMNNLRLHYIDVRDFIDPVIYKLLLSVGDYINNMMTNRSLNTKHINYLIKAFSTIKSKVDFISDILKDNDIKYTKTSLLNKIDNMDVEDIENNTKYIIHKIKNKYNNNIIKSNINNIINTDIFNLINKFNDIHNQIIKLLNTVNKTIISPLTFNFNKTYPSYGIDSNYKIDVLSLILQLYNDYFQIYLRLTSMLMDIYFLRRFLDKDYITNGVTYTGSLHSLHYIYYLIKVFNFKITHYSLLNKPLKEVYQIIDKSNNPDELTKLFYPYKLIQCSDLSSFPSNFK